MERINDKLVRFVQFDPSNSWHDELPIRNWILILLTQDKCEAFFKEIISKSIDKHVCYICSIGEQEDLVHIMADDEILLRNLNYESNYLPEHEIITTGHENLEEGLWFGIFSAFHDECKIKDIIIINMTNNENERQKYLNLIEKFRAGYIPND